MTTGSRAPRDRDTERVEWLWIGLAGVQAGYNYIRWKRGLRTTAGPSAAPDRGEQR